MKRKKAPGPNISRTQITQWNTLFAFFFFVVVRCHSFSFRLPQFNGHNCLCVFVRWVRSRWLWFQFQEAQVFSIYGSPAFPVLTIYHHPRLHTWFFFSFDFIPLDNICHFILMLFMCSHIANHCYRFELRCSVTPLFFLHLFHTIAISIWLVIFYALLVYVIFFFFALLVVVLCISFFIFIQSFAIARSFLSLSVLAHVHVCRLISLPLAKAVR